MKVEELAQTLEKFLEGEISEDEAFGFIKNATPKEFSKAEQLLMERGMPRSELKKFCKIHIRTVEEKVNKIKSKLSTNHPLYILISEHEEILKILDELEGLRESIQNVGFNPDKKKKLKTLAEKLVDTERHHKREEEVVFPRLEESDFDGPPSIMTDDHKEFKPRKKRLLEISENPEENKEEILDLIDFLTFNERDHIYKENNIIYPTALEELEDWDIMSEEGEKIGYCAFYTPELEK